MFIKTLHGKFQFQLQKYQVDGIGVSYFELTQQLAEGYISPRLQEFSTYYSNRLSYEEVEKLVERVSKAKLLSDQKIAEIVSDKAQKLSQEMQEEVRATLSKTQLYELKVNPKVNIYHPEKPEILVFDDGIRFQRAKSSKASVRQGLGRQEARHS